jgi:hypothetical protein
MFENLKMEEIEIDNSSLTTISDLQDVKEVLRHLRMCHDVGQNQLVENLKMTYKVRHNLIHLLLVNTLPRQHRYYIEQNVSAFGLSVNSKFSNLTPDLVIMLDGNVVFCDVTVSRSESESRTQKKKKYLPLCQDVLILNDNVRFADIFCFHFNPDFSNAEATFFEFQKWLTKSGLKIKLSEFDFVTARLMLSEILQTQQIIRAEVGDSIILERVMAEEYKPKVLANTGLEMVKDLQENNPECESLHFKGYKNGQIVDNLAVCSEDEIAGIFKGLLNDPDILNEFYEVKTTPEQIKDAYVSVSESNEHMKHMQVPKPSIHTFATSDCKPICLHAGPYVQAEQNQIYTLCHLVKNLNPFETPYSMFVQEFSGHFLSMTSGNKAKNFNQGIFDFNQIGNKTENSELRSLYDAYRSQSFQSKSPIKSFHDFASTHIKTTIAIPTQEEVKAVKQKIIKIPISQMSTQMKETWMKSHSGSKKETRG